MKKLEKMRLVHNEYAAIYWIGGKEQMYWVELNDGRVLAKVKLLSWAERIMGELIF